jgi:hypothetical protein
MAGGRVGPPSGDGAAWTIGASANASTKAVAVNMVFRFLILLLSSLVLAFLDLSFIENSFPAVQ